MSRLTSRVMVSHVNFVFDYPPPTSRHIFLSFCFSRISALSTCFAQRQMFSFWIITTLHDAGRMTFQPARNQPCARTLLKALPACSLADFFFSNMGFPNSSSTDQGGCRQEPSTIIAIVDDRAGTRMPRPPGRL